MQKKHYNTQGRQALLDFLAQNPDSQFSVPTLCRHINGNAEQGKSSIYRNLTALCQSETVRKFRSEKENCYVYQYVGERCDCSLHFHQKCLRCGELRHLDCKDSTDFATHLLHEHGFAVDRGQTILYGLCAVCRKAQEVEQ